MNNKRLNITSVSSIARKMCDYVEGIQHEVISAGVKLEEDGEEKDFLTFFVCPVDEIADAMAFIDSMNGSNREDFVLPKKYCHITTFENNMHSRSQISFDEKDDFPVKAKFNSEYQYLDVFFNRFFQYRDQLIGNDVEEYFDLISQDMTVKVSKKKKNVK